MNLIVKYKVAQAKQLTAQADVAELWGKMSPEERRIASVVATWT